MHFDMTLIFLFYIGSRNVGRSDVQDCQRVRIFFYKIIKCLFLFFDQPWTSVIVAIKIFFWFGLFQISLIFFSFLSYPLLESQKRKTKVELLIRFLNLRRN